MKHRVTFALIHRELDRYKSNQPWPYKADTPSASGRTGPLTEKRCQSTPLKGRLQIISKKSAP